MPPGLHYSHWPVEPSSTAHVDSRRSTTIKMRIYLFGTSYSAAWVTITRLKLHPPGLIDLWKESSEEMQYFQKFFVRKWCITFVNENMLWGSMNSISDAEAWKCAICQELLYKPVANVCGHLFCFWCAHKAMSPFSSSKCPLCRTHDGNFPAVRVLGLGFLFLMRLVRNRDAL